MNFGYSTELDAFLAGNTPDPTVTPVYSPELQSIMDEGTEVPVDTSVTEDLNTLDPVTIATPAAQTLSMSMFGNVWIWLAGGAILFLLYRRA